MNLTSNKNRSKAIDSVRAVAMDNNISYSLLIKFIASNKALPLFQDVIETYKLQELMNDERSTTTSPQKKSRGRDKGPLLRPWTNSSVSKGLRRRFGNKGGLAGFDFP